MPKYTFQPRYKNPDQTYTFLPDLEVEVEMGAPLYPGIQIGVANLRFEVALMGSPPTRQILAFVDFPAGESERDAVSAIWRAQMM